MEVGEEKVINSVRENRLALKTQHHTKGKGSVSRCSLEGNPSGGW